MSEKLHRAALNLHWTGNRGAGTAAYRAYSRAHRITAAGKLPIEGSSDPAFRGDPARWNPEELLLASVAACHQLWYLHLCAEAGVVVTSYEDAPDATWQEEADGGGRVVAATLRPRVGIAAGSDPARAASLHDAAHEKCFIARSVNFPIAHEPTIHVGEQAG